MKLSELHRKYSDALELCEMHGIDHLNAIKFNGDFLQGFPVLNYPDDDFTFPVAVVEGKPVFVDDVLYDALGRKVIVATTFKQSMVTTESWSPPKPKTFMLNGVEFIAPDNEPNGYHIGDIARFKWDNHNDRDAFYNAIIGLLEGKSQS
jgi:hypothetical protein